MPKCPECGASKKSLSLQIVPVVVSILAIGLSVFTIMGGKELAIEYFLERDLKVLLKELTPLPRRGSSEWERIRDQYQDCIIAIDIEADDTSAAEMACGEIFLTIDRKKLEYELRAAQVAVFFDRHWEDLSIHTVVDKGRSFCDGVSSARRRIAFFEEMRPAWDRGARTHRSETPIASSDEPTFEICQALAKGRFYGVGLSLDALW